MAYSQRFKALKAQEEQLKAQAVVAEHLMSFEAMRAENMRRMKEMEERKRREKEKENSRIESELKNRKAANSAYVESLRGMLKKMRKPDSGSAGRRNGSMDSMSIEAERRRAELSRELFGPHGTDDEAGISVIRDDARVVVKRANQASEPRENQSGSSRYETTLYDSLETEDIVRELDAENGWHGSTQVSLVPDFSYLGAKKPSKSQRPQQAQPQQVQPQPKKPRSSLGSAKERPPSKDELDAKMRKFQAIVDASKMMMAASNARMKAQAESGELRASRLVDSLDLTTGSLKGVLSAVCAADDVAAMPLAKTREEDHAVSSASGRVEARPRVFNPHEVRRTNSKPIPEIDSGLGSLGDLSMIPFGAPQASILDSLDLGNPALRKAGVDVARQRGPASVSGSRIPVPRKSHAKPVPAAGAVVAGHRTPPPASLPQGRVIVGLPRPSEAAVDATLDERPSTAELFAGAVDPAPKADHGLADSTQLFLAAEELAHESGMTATQILKSLYQPPAAAGGGKMALGANYAAPNPLLSTVALNEAELKLQASIARLDLVLKEKHSVRGGGSSNCSVADESRSVMSHGSRRTSSVGTGSAVSLVSNRKPALQHSTRGRVAMGKRNAVHIAP